MRPCAIQHGGRLAAMETGRFGSGQVLLERVSYSPRESPPAHPRCVPRRLTKRRHRTRCPRIPAARRCRFNVREIIGFCTPPALRPGTVIGTAVLILAVPDL